MEAGLAADSSGAGAASVAPNIKTGVPGTDANGVGVAGGLNENLDVDPTSSRAEARLSGVGPVVGSLASRSKCLVAAAARMWSGFGRAVSVTSMTPVAPVCGHPSLPSCQGTLTPAIPEFFFPLEEDGWS